MTVQKQYARVRELAAELADLGSAASLLGWDQETKMPRKGTEGRGGVSATLAGIIHERLTSPELQDLLGGLGEANGELTDVDHAIVRDLSRTVERATRVPGDLVKRIAAHRPRSSATWAHAREKKDFRAFAPLLETMMEYQRELADALGHNGDRYDALLEEYEPGAKTAEVAALLEEVKAFLVPFVKEIGESSVKPDLSCVLGPFDEAKQGQFVSEVVGAMGFDLEGGRIDLSNHPFCSGIHAGDVRLTVRYKPDMRVGLLGAMHEAGHGLYEQGALAAHGRTPLGNVKSLGIHESQSRLWENNVGLSREFWVAFYPRLQELFPENLKDVDLDTFHLAMNDVRPSFIRIEADEVTYCLHIAVRFELERALMAGDIKIQDLPQAWNDKYTEYLGVTPPDDSVGVLQDIHWSAGLVGYFPTYMLGSLNAAQFVAAAGKDLPNMSKDFAKGNLLPLRDWLVTNVHSHGSRYLPQELMEKATGSPTKTGDFVAYAKGKYGALYGLGGEA